MVRDKSQTRKLKDHVKKFLNKNHLIGDLNGKSPEEALTEHWFDLIDQMLLLDPQKRLTASKALKHPFFTEKSLEQACQPADLPVKDLEGDHHEFITKAERNKKQNFKKWYSFKHNKDQNNYNDPYLYSNNEPSFWKSTNLQF